MGLAYDQQPSLLYERKLAELLRMLCLLPPRAICQASSLAAR